MKAFRNVAFLVLVCSLVWSISANATALDCEPIVGGFWEECETDENDTNCTSIFVDPFAEWCDEHFDDTCADFCGGLGNVIAPSQCYYDGNWWYAGGHQQCVSGLDIYCRCSEVEGK